MSALGRRRFLAVVSSIPAIGACALATREDAGAAGNADPDDTLPGTVGRDDGGVTTSPANDAGSTTTNPSVDAGTTTMPATDAGPSCHPLSIDLGPATDFPLNTWKAFGSGRSSYVVGHDGGGFYVVSACCTHKWCTNDPPDATGAQSCPCHGAQFDPDGHVLSGPTTVDLPNYQVVSCGGRLSTDLTKTVPAGTRVKP